MKTKTITQPQRTCAFKKILSRMPPRSHWPKRPETFYISDSQVVLFIRNETGIKDWSRAMTIFHEAKKNKVIIFDRKTLLWRGYLYDGKVCKSPPISDRKLPGTGKHTHPNIGSDRLSYF